MVDIHRNDVTVLNPVRKIRLEYRQTDIDSVASKYPAK
jgi:hypothetical protein